MEDQDWLDARMAVDNYIPDAGFTARVVDRLPAQRTPAAVARGRILAFTALLAFVLVAVQIVPLFRAALQFTAHHSPADVFGASLYLLQPSILFRAAAVMIALAVASIPLLRRWA